MERLDDLLIVILGPTASGKTTAALEIAQNFDGEIICADSRTIYKNMNVGTAKPTINEQKIIKHYGLDLIEPNQTFSAARFKKLAEQAIKDIRSRGKLPIIAGGTGLYIDSLIFNYKFGTIADSVNREYLESKSITELQNIINDKGLNMPENSKNPRHLIRTIELDGEKPSRDTLRSDALLVGINPGLPQIKERIINRTNTMISQGLIDETKKLIQDYSKDAPGLLAPAYKPMIEYLSGTINLEEAIVKMVKNDYLLARRQLTWFKRNKSIQWQNNGDSAVAFITTYLNKIITIK